MILFVFEGEMQRNLNQSAGQGCCVSEGNIQAQLQKYVLLSGRGHASFLEALIIN